MKKFIYPLIGLAFAACNPAQKTPTNAQPIAMLVGTYTGGESCGIYSFIFDQQNGTTQAMDSAQIQNPSFLTTSANGRMVYAVSEMNDSTASVVSFTFNPKSGSLEYRNSQRTNGEAPCYVSTNGKILLTANYTGGSMSVFPLDSNGNIKPMASAFNGSIGGPDSNRQAKPHVHCAFFTPDGKYILATDFSSDSILTFQLNNANEPIKGNSFAVESDTGPRHITMSPNGKYVYVIGELSGHVTAFDYNDGKLTPIQTIAADTIHARGSADIHVSPDGKFLYASNRLKDDGIAIFNIDNSNGKLTRIGYQHTGKHPRNFQITPNGKYLLVACRDSNVIQVYLRDTESGLLKNTGNDIHVTEPVCIEFIK